MGGIKSYKIHIKLDLMYPLFVEKILIPSRINSLQIMYSKAVDSSYKHKRISFNSKIFSKLYSNITHRIVSSLLLEAKLFPAINKKIARKVLRSILIFSTNQPFCTYVAAMINYQNFHSKRDAALTCHFTTSCSCWVKAVAKLALKTFYQNVFILTHILIEFPLQKIQNQFLLTILFEQTFEVTKFGNINMLSLTEKNLSCLI